MIEVFGFENSHNAKSPFLYTMLSKWEEITEVQLSICMTSINATYSSVFRLIEQTLIIKIHTFFI